MKQNIGKIDKIIRWIIGLVIISAGVYFRSWWGLLGLVPIVTASISLCPLYLPFGISTCNIKNK
jgi:hypothetical protein